MIEETEFICEQRHIIVRPDRVFVDIKDDKVLFGRKAKIVEETSLDV